MPARKKKSTRITKVVEGPGQQLVSLILGNRGGGVIAKLKPPPPKLESKAFCDANYKGSAAGIRQISGTVKGKLKFL